MRHLSKPIILFTIFTTISSTTHADDVDRAFEAQRKRPNVKMTSAVNLMPSIRIKAKAVRERAIEREFERAEEMASIQRDSLKEQPEQDAVPNLRNDQNTNLPKIDTEQDVPRSLTERVSSFWLLKNEVQSITARCGESEREVVYEFYTKTSRFCTPRMACSIDESWVQRALCR